MKMNSSFTVLANKMHAYVHHDRHIHGGAGAPLLTFFETTAGLEDFRWKHL